MKNYANYIGLSIVVTALAIAVLYFEIYLGLQPCPLCMVDRFILGFIALIFIIAIAKPSKKVTCNIINTVLSGLGILVAARHVWLQHSLEKGSSCVADYSNAFQLVLNSVNPGTISDPSGLYCEGSVPPVLGITSTVTSTFPITYQWYKAETND